MISFKTIPFLILLIFILSCKKGGNYISDDTIIQLNIFNADSTYSLIFEGSNFDPTDYSQDEKSIIINDTSAYNKLFCLDTIKIFCLNPKVDFSQYSVLGISSVENAYIVPYFKAKSFYKIETNSKKNTETNDYVINIATTIFFENGDNEKPSDISSLPRYCWFELPKTADISKLIIDRSNIKLDNINKIDLQSYCGTFKGYVKKYNNNNNNGNNTCSDSSLVLGLYYSNSTPFFEIKYGTSHANVIKAILINNILQLQTSNMSDYNSFGQEDTYNYIDLSNNTIVVYVKCGIFYGKKI